MLFFPSPRMPKAPTMPHAARPLPRRPLSLVCLIALAGCGGGHPDRPPVHRAGGVVLEGDKPVAGAHVTYQFRGEPPRTAYGTTDGQGRYRLTTFDTDDGAVAGEHEVKVVKLEAAAPSAADAGSVPPGGATRPAPKPKSLVPAKFGKFETSGLKATVEKSGRNELTIDLSK